MQHNTLLLQSMNGKLFLQMTNYKDIIIDSLQYLANDKRIELNAFVIYEQPYSFNMAGVNRFYAFRCTGVFYEIYCTENKAFTYKT